MKLVFQEPTTNNYKREPKGPLLRSKTMEFNSKKLFKTNSSNIIFLSYYSMKKNPLFSDIVELNT